MQIARPSDLYRAVRHVSHVARILATFFILHEARTFREWKVGSSRNFTICVGYLEYFLPLPFVNGSNLKISA